MGEIDDIKARLEKLEILASEQERMIEDLNGTITGQWREIEALRRQLAKLDDELREVEAGLPAPPNQKPPHY
jgi:SlyX protein